MMVEEEEEEEVLTFCRMIIEDIDIQDQSVKIRQDNLTRSNMLVSTYNFADNQSRLTVEIRGLNW